MGLDDVAAVDLAGADTTVVRTLGTGETAPRPAVGSTELVEKGVLLLETEPGDVVLVGPHELGTLVAVVELVGGAVGVPALGEDEDVVTATERVREDGDGAQVDVGVLAGGLAGGGAVKVPLRKIVDRGGLLGEGLSRWPVSARVEPVPRWWVPHPRHTERPRSVAYLGFTAESVASVDPDVLGLDGVVLRQVQVPLQSSSVGDNRGAGLVGAQPSTRVHSSGVEPK